MKGKLKFIVPIVLLLAVGGVYKFVLAKPKAEAHKKVEGEVYVLPKEFLVNLADGRYAKLNVALVMEPGAHTAAEGGGHGGAAAAPPEGFGTLPQEALVRAIVTDTVTDVSGSTLISEKGRNRLKRQIAKSLQRNTDVHVEDVLFTDVAVQ